MYTTRFINRTPEDLKDNYTNCWISIRCKPGRTSERTTNDPKNCLQTFSINSVPNPEQISGPSDIPVCVSSGIAAREFTFCRLDSARCGYACAGGGCAENPSNR